MDITAAKLGANMAISELSASGQIGSTIKPVYTYDGDPSKVVVVEGLSVVKMSDTAHDLSTLTTIKYCDGGVVKTATSDEIELSSFQGVPTAMVPIDNVDRGAIAILLSIPDKIGAMWGLTGGLYSMADVGGGFYATYVEFSEETIKPADTKYVSTILDLTQYRGVFDIPNAAPASLNELVIQMLNAAAFAQGQAVWTYIELDTGEFKHDASGHGLVTIRMDVNGGVVDFLTLTARNPDGSIAQISASALVEAPNIGTIEEKIIFQFGYDSNTTIRLLLKVDAIPNVSLEELLQTPIT